MKDIKIPDEINGYEAKIVAGFSIRQFILIMVGLFLTVFVFALIKDYFYMPICMAVVTVLFTPFLAFGWFKPYGISFDKYLKVIIYCGRRNKKRGYRIQNRSLNILKNINTNSKKDKKEKKKKNKKMKEKDLSDLEKNYEMIKDKQKKQTKLKKTGGKGFGSFVKKR